MEKFQGEDIDFKLIYKKGEDFNVSDWSKFQEVIVFMYTDGCVIVRFSTITKSGYEKLNLSDSITLSGNIKSDYTKILAPGVVTIEIKAILNDSMSIERKATGIVLKKNIIKL